MEFGIQAGRRAWERDGEDQLEINEELKEEKNVVQKEGFIKVLQRL